MELDNWVIKDANSQNIVHFYGCRIDVKDNGVLVVLKYNEDKNCWSPIAYYGRRQWVFAKKH